MPTRAARIDRTCCAEKLSFRVNEISRISTCYAPGCEQFLWITSPGAGLNREGLPSFIDLHSVRRESPPMGAANARRIFLSPDQRLESSIRELSTGLQTDSVDNPTRRKAAPRLVLQHMAQLSRAAILPCRISNLPCFSASYQRACEQKVWINHVCH